MSHSSEEVYDVYLEKLTRANKVHFCVACAEPIAKGHRYVRVESLFDGNWLHLKRCLRCQVMHVHLQSLCVDAGYEQWPDEWLNCGRTYEDEWDTPPPDDVAALAFITSDEAQSSLLTEDGTDTIEL